jgi:hypothetical protein
MMMDTDSRIAEPMSPLIGRTADGGPAGTSATSSPVLVEAADPGPVVLIPVFNDWAVVAKLIPRLDAALAARGYTARLLVVDDGSTDSRPDELADAPLAAIREVRIVRLRRNLGHQRALAIGICHVHEHVPCRAIVVMDGDGEDLPEDVPRLLEAMEANGRRKSVFAERLRRSESTAFRALYWLYRQVHLLLTGVKVRVGNFSAEPAGQIERLVVASDLWNHYAASVVQARLPVEHLPTSRGQRLHGRSHMNMVSLVIHGLSAISVFADRVGVRMLILGAVVLLVGLLGLLGIVVLRLFTTLAIPGWATTAAGLVLVMLIQVVTLLLAFVFITLRGREAASFLPLRDYAYFVAGLKRPS